MTLPQPRPPTPWPADHPKPREPEPKWPPGRALALIVAVSAAMWAGIILAVRAVVTAVWYGWMIGAVALWMLAG